MVWLGDNKGKELNTLRLFLFSYFCKQPTRKISHKKRSKVVRSKVTDFEIFSRKRSKKSDPKLVNYCILVSTLMKNDVLTLTYLFEDFLYRWNECVLYVECCTIFVHPFCCICTSLKCALLVHFCHRSESAWIELK